MNKKSPFVTAKVHDQLIELCRSAVMLGLSYEEVQSKVSRHFVKLKVAEKYEKIKEDSRSRQVKKRLHGLVRAGSFLLPLFFLIAGVYLVGLAVVPILGYYIEDAQNPQESELTAPIPRQYVMDLTPMIAVSDQNSALGLNKNAKPPTIVESSIDYTNLANWFTTDTASFTAQLGQDKSDIQEYELSIPTIDVERAVVKVGGNDLNQSLIAYPGTAMPGEFGSPVIFGHSVLRKFYNPSSKNPRRYTSIFSYIMTLKPGEDKINIKAGGVNYTYLVQSKTEVRPEDVHILNQQYSSKLIKLVTCVPEGTYLRRGIVTAQLIESESE